MARHGTPPPDAGPEAFAPGASRPPGPNPFAAAAGLLGSLLTVPLLSAAAAWWWLGTPQSLATALAQGARWLPPGQQLESRAVQGSLRSGGHIDWLRWSSPTLTVEAHDIHLAWSLAPLLQRTVQLDDVRAARVHITPTPPPEATPPGTPPQQLVLPVRVDLPFHIDQLEWRGAPAVQAHALGGRYRHDGAQHRLEITGIDLAQGHYSARATLQAQAPMALQAEAEGRVRTTLPGTPQPLELAAQATLQGTLASSAARLQLQARLHPLDSSALPSAARSLRADATAELAPWVAQPLQQARAELQAIDLAALWPQAPATLLHGSVQAGPDAAGWQVTARLRNERPGPWDRQRLPLDTLDATAHFDGTRWNVPSASARAGPGQIALQGHFTPGTGLLEGQAKVQGLRPATLHSQLGSAPLSGTLGAQRQGEAVRFTVDLRAPASASPAAPRQRLPVRSLQASGHWRPPLLSLQRLDIDALQARLHAQPLDIHLGTAPSAQGDITLTVPGATARAKGQLGAAAGAGELQIDLATAERTLDWLRQLPGLERVPDGLRLQGQARLDARWQGGWQGLRPASTHPEFRVEATLHAPRLDLALPASGNAAPTTVPLRAVRAGLSGTLAQAALTLDGQALWGERSLHWQTRLQTGRGEASAAATAWHADLDSLRLQWQDGQHPAPWTLQLAQPLALTLRQPHGSAPAPATLQAQGGQATLTSPLPGRVDLRWQPLRMALAGAPQAQTSGTFTGLPLAWAEALVPGGTAALAEQGLAGDLVFQGGWALDLGDALRASAHLERTGGDLRIRAGAAGPAGTPAGVREASLRLDAQGTALRARLRWDSERAGRITADAETQLGTEGGAWTWPAQAPVSARVQAALPELGAWTMLAPPGWRVHGTLDADATLSGTRAAPRWHGTLGANGLALRSLADGVDLQGGRLRAELRGDRLDITELRLHGGPGSGAHIPGFSGNRTPAPRDGGELLGSGSIRWAGAHATGPTLDFTAQARALQVQVRADRQASVSGTVRAALEQGRLAVRGQLVLDRATLLLPDETAPRLGPDVVVRPAAHAPPPPAPAAPRATPRQPPDLDITLDLGQDFALQGQGITTRLEGQLAIRNGATADSPPRVTGEVRTVQGRYRAWGQLLDVETGLVRFNGAHDNPVLDILALRPGITVRAGVQVSGTALAPRVRLYAEPELPDAEKLAWVVLGRSATSGGAESALLQQAALALLGSRGNAAGTRLAGRLGLDEIGFKGPASGTDATGAALTLGKRLSQDLYVTYERSLSGTLGTLYIFYDLSQRLTLRGQTGGKSGLDIIYTVRHD